MGLPNPDPLSQVMDQLWFALESRPELVALVKLKNRAKRTGADAEKVIPPEDAVDQDFPALDIMPAGGLYELTRSSTGLGASVDFEVVHSAADARLDRSFFPLQWELVVALAGHYYRTGCNLGLPFVTGMKVSNYTNTENAQAILRGLSGWSALLTVTVDMAFDRKDF